MKTAVIFNPRSGGTGKWPELARLLGRRLGPFEVCQTQRSGHAIALARELIERGVERIIAAGGDGTINEVVNGFLESGETLHPTASLAILPLGTGGDFRRTLGVSRDLREAVEGLAAAVPVVIDAGKVSFQDAQGARRARYFANLVSFGMGGEVAAGAKNFLSPLGGTVAFYYASMAALLRYRRKEVRLRLDGGETPQTVGIYNVAVGNGRFHGGGMQACPTARPDDGVLEVTVIEYMSVWEAVRDFPILYSDDVYRHPKVRHLRARRIVAEADEPVRIEVDGEPLGSLPLEISVLPQRLRVLVPASSPLLAR